MPCQVRLRQRGHPRDLRCSLNCYVVLRMRGRRLRLWCRFACRRYRQSQYPISVSVVRPHCIRIRISNLRRWFRRMSEARRCLGYGRRTRPSLQVLRRCRSFRGTWRLLHRNILFFSPASIRFHLHGPDLVVGRPRRHLSVIRIERWRWMHQSCCWRRFRS